MVFLLPPSPINNEITSLLVDGPFGCPHVQFYALSS